MKKAFIYVLYPPTGTALGNLRNTFWTSAWFRPTKRSKAAFSHHLSFIFSPLYFAPLFNTN